MMQCAAVVVLAALFFEFSSRFDLIAIFHSSTNCVTLGRVPEMLT